MARRPPSASSRADAGDLSLQNGSKSDAEEATSTKILRATSLLCSFLVALSAGSNYGFSSYSPQLQERLALTSTQINIVGVMGNVGVYLSGPFWGRLVDKRGPKVALAVGATLVLIGYGGLSTSYEKTFPSTPSIWLLAILSLLTGLGNSAAFTAAMNAQAKSWSQKRRGVCTAIVLSGFGLSAFFYSSLSHTLFPGKTGDYLLLLALGSSFTFTLGFFVIRIIPAATERAAIEGASAASEGGRTSTDTENRPYNDDDNNNEREMEGAAAAAQREEGFRRPPVFTRRRTSSEVGGRAYAHLSQPPEDEGSCNSDAGGDEDEEEGDDIENGAGASLDQDDRAEERQGLLGSSSREDLPRRSRSASSGINGKHQDRARAKRHQHEHIDVTGWKLMKMVDFILLFVIMGLISGTGLLVINNIGTITKTLYEFNKPHHVDPNSNLGALHQALDAIHSISTREDEVLIQGHQTPADVQQLQAHQVSAISLGNAIGRIAIGLLSDVFVTWTRSPRQRVWLLIPVCILALVSQGLAASPGTIDTVDKLMVVSSLTGLMYGTLFGLCPVLTFEWFGLRHFSQNWGIVSLNPVIAGNIFNLLFGSIYDSHVPKGAPAHLCPYGEECFRSVFKVTEAAAVVAFGLSLVIILRRAGRPEWTKA